MADDILGIGAGEVGLDDDKGEGKTGDGMIGEEFVSVSDGNGR